MCLNLRRVVEGMRAEGSSVYRGILGQRKLSVSGLMWHIAPQPPRHHWASSEVEAIKSGQQLSVASLRIHIFDG